jgi:hypothetical protein
MLEGGGKTPILSPVELEEIGYKIIAYPLSLIGVSMRAMEVCFSFIYVNRIFSFIYANSMIVFHLYMSLFHCTTNCISVDHAQCLQSELELPFDRTKNNPAALTTSKFGISNMELLKACFCRE